MNFPFRNLMVALIAISFFSVSVRAQNTFPSTGRVGIYTTSPATSLQVKGGARIGTAANYVNIDSATGNLSFSGTSGYQLAGNKYAFQYSGNPNYGLFFNSSSVQYEFRNGSAAPVFSVNANTGNSVFNGTLKIGAYTLPSTDGSSGQALTTNGSGTVSWLTVSGGSGGSQWTTSGSNIYYNTGNVGIGNTAPSIAGLVVDTKVGSVNSVFGSNTTGVAIESNYPGIGFNTYYNNGRKFIGNGYGASIGYDPTVGLLGFYNSGGSGSAGSAATVVADMSITAGGYIGVGTTTPQAKLDVNGDAHINGLTVGIGSGNIQSNSVFGNQALFSNTTGLDNTANGDHALYANTTGNYNIATGESALLSNTTGSLNTATGNFALYFNTTGADNTATGESTLFSNTTGNFNTATGLNALYSNTTGSVNTANGYEALFHNTTGSNNTATGYYALFSNTTGYSNIAMGVKALFNNQTSSNMVAIGDSALYNNGSGIQNVATGSKTLYSNTSGNYNTANGFQSLYSNTSGSANTANGTSSLYFNTTGSSNTAVGSNALYSNTTGSNNSATGFGALEANTTGNANTATGYQALYFNTTGYNNTANGDYALYHNTTGSNNTANGVSALVFNTTGSDNTANGYQALENNTTGGYNTATGVNALAINTTGSDNTANGYYALENNTTGNYNTANGVNALQYNTTGSVNTATGYQSLKYNTIGSDNTANGYEALYDNTTGNYNTANGEDALYDNTDGYYNTANGYEALYSNTEGYYNTATGHYALFSNTTGGSNTANGDEALHVNTTGSFNTANGGEALYSITTGGENTALGYDASPADGTVFNYTGIGWDVGGTTSASNEVEIGNTSVSVIRGEVNFSTYSDKRIKNNIQQNVPGLAFITKLTPVTYKLDIHKENDMMYAGKTINGKKEKEVDFAGKYDLEQKQMTGFLAQDVEAAAEAVHYDFSGVVKPRNDHDLYSLRYSDFVVPLVKAVQELNKMNAAKDVSIDSLATANAAQQKQIADLTVRLDKIEAMLSLQGNTVTTNKATINAQTIELNGAATLSQNIPNPFSNSTAISYYLPVNNGNAFLTFYNELGTPLKTVPLSGNGNGTVTLKASDLPSGVYRYTLVIDGKVIDSKQMILAK